jgi:hypothetical protein
MGLGPAMTTRAKLVILKLLVGMFNLIWIGAAIALVYFLYGALANDSPWSYLSWPFAVGFFARLAAVAVKDNRQRVDYVNQLMERGYAQRDADSAWRIATTGGTNLLRNLQQAELNDEIDRLESAIDTPSAKGNSA